MPELAVVVPTYNERDNVVPLVEALDRALAGIDYEVIFVDDDSPDGTSEVARSLAQTDARVRVIQRIRRRGLASASVEGMMSTSAPYVAVIDGDLQHDETLLPKMLSLVKEQKLDLAIGSRNIGGGSMGDFSRLRVALSNLGRSLSRAVCHASLSDPMSGFFLADRRFLDEVVRRLSARGFKILLDLVASSPRPVRFAEIGYSFRTRDRGESKLDVPVALEYIELLIDKLVGDWVPVSYVLFAAVGSLGVVLHVMTVQLLIRLGGWTFEAAQLASSIAAMTVNYFLNNYVTFRSVRNRGWRLPLGLILFNIASGVGLFANLGLAKMLMANGVRLWAASAAGLIVGSVWNYWVSSELVWGVSRRRSRRALSKNPRARQTVL